MRSFDLYVDGLTQREFEREFGDGERGPDGSDWGAEYDAAFPFAPPTAAELDAMAAAFADPPAADADDDELDSDLDTPDDPTPLHPDDDLGESGA